MLGNYQQLVNVMGYSSMPTGIFTIFVLLAIWSIIWKGIALWKSARNGSKVWYIIMLLVNTVGILEIIYIFFVGKRKSQINPSNPM